MSESGKAVFLSYASQDAEAAKRICDALRQAGVEVWFDTDGGLEHGDEWDAKIRRQIKECVLFLPIISANTQAREEGYFRIEWDLAAERARGIASGVAFILPIVIDETREPDALVPDRFRSVQWTKLHGGVIAPEVQARFLKLWSHRTGLLKSTASADPSPETQPLAPASPPPSRARWPLVLSVGTTVAAIGFGLFLAMRPAPSPVAAPMESKSPAPPASPAASKRYASSRPEVAALLARVQMMTDKTDVARGELETALSLIDQAALLDSTDANVWAERALIECRYVIDNLDNTPARKNAALQHARQATSLDPKNPNARMSDALTQWMVAANDAVRDAAATTFASLVADDSDRFDAYFFLALEKVRNRQSDEAFALLDRAARLPGAAGRAALQKAILLFSGRDWTKANEGFDQALALDRSASALVWKSHIATFWLGDIALAKQAIAGIPAGMLTEDFPAAGKLYVEFWARDWNAAIATLRTIPRDYLGSGALSGPTGYYLGYAHDQAGRKNAAEIEWRSALEVVNKRLESDPRDPTLFAMKALLLAALGDRTGGERTLQTLRELYPASWDYSWMGHMLAMTLLPPEEAIDRLAKKSRKGMEEGLNGNLKLDPFLDHLRAHPRFVELLAKVESDPKLNPAAAPTPSRETAPMKPTSPTPTLAEKSVAVLAFANLSDDKANEYFSDGISEELLNVLAKVPGLKVSARTSAFHFKGKDTAIKEIAQQLGVAYVVEGSVRKAGDKVRITAQLIKAVDGFHVWSDTFTRDLKDIFAVQDEIAGLIAQQLQLKLGESARVTKVVNPEAHRLVLEGRYFWGQRNDVAFERAEAAYQRALALDSEFAEAHAGLADVWAVRGWYRIMAGNAVQAAADFVRAKEEVRWAQALNPALAEPYATLGVVLMNEFMFDEAERQFAQAITLNPNYAVARHWHSTLLLAVGRRDESLKEIERAISLDPLSPNFLWQKASSTLDARGGREALDATERALALRPGHPTILSIQAQTLWHLGRRDEAIAAARAVGRDLTAQPRWFADSTAIYVLRQAGLQSEAEAYAERALANVPKDDYRYATTLVALGRGNEALPLLRMLPVSGLTNVYWHPMWDSLREDAQFQQWLVKLGCAAEYKVAREPQARLLKEQEAKK